MTGLAAGSARPDGPASRSREACAVSEPSVGTMKSVLVFMSACLSGGGCAGADGVDDVADGLAGLGGGGLVLGEHGVAAVRQRAMNAVGRQCGERVLRGHP